MRALLALLVCALLLPGCLQGARPAPSDPAQTLDHVEFRPGMTLRLDYSGTDGRAAATYTRLLHFPQPLHVSFDQPVAQPYDLAFAALVPAAPGPLPACAPNLASRHASDLNGTPALDPIAGDYPAGWYHFVAASTFVSGTLELRSTGLVGNGTASLAGSDPLAKAQALALYKAPVSSALSAFPATLHADVARAAWWGWGMLQVGQVGVDANTAVPRFDGGYTASVAVNGECSRTAVTQPPTPSGTQSLSLAALGTARAVDVTGSFAPTNPATGGGYETYLACLLQADPVPTA